MSRLHLRRTVTLDEGIGELRKLIFPLCYEKPISGIWIYLTSVYIKLRSIILATALKIGYRAAREMWEYQLGG